MHHAGGGSKLAGCPGDGDDHNNDGDDQGDDFVLIDIREKLRQGGIFLCAEDLNKTERRNQRANALQSAIPECREALLIAIGDPGHRHGAADPCGELRAGDEELAHASAANEEVVAVLDLTSGKNTDQKVQYDDRTENDKTCYAE